MTNTKDKINFIEKYGTTPKQTGKILKMLDDGIINRNGAREASKYCAEYNIKVLKAMCDLLEEGEVDFSNYDELKEEMQKRLQEMEKPLDTP